MRAPDPPGRSSCPDGPGGARPLSHGELAARLKLQKSTVSRLVRQLQKRNWVVREVSRKDNRVILVRLTRKGLAAGKRLAFARQNKFASVLAAIPRAERNRVQRAHHPDSRAGEKAALKRSVCRYSAVKSAQRASAVGIRPPFIEERWTSPALNVPSGPLS
ncbi:MAG: MarR family transcriptional regulator, partial [Chthoniobacterales bacterium]|nr:MarR family transcriptional regulator [Chthoniobacterales bacterium]